MSTLTHPNPGGRKRRDPRVYRSSCPACHYGIYQGDPTVWITRPVTGTVHQACAAGTEPTESKG